MNTFSIRPDSGPKFVSVMLTIFTLSGCFVFIALMGKAMKPKEGE